MLQRGTRARGMCRVNQSHKTATSPLRRAESRFVGAPTVQRDRRRRAPLLVSPEILSLRGKRRRFLRVAAPWHILVSTGPPPSSLQTYKWADGVSSGRYLTCRTSMSTTAIGSPVCWGERREPPSQLRIPRRRETWRLPSGLTK